ncbi:MAG: pantothenate synthase [Candelina submexicana]|nr:MAG: pantothenate synthase [Candelina submexicana]
MKIFRDVQDVRRHRKHLLLSNRTVGLVPTMGALHAGHLALIRQAAQENSDVFVSVYVNPTQFGVTEDLESYPRTWDADIKMLELLNDELAASSPQNGRISAIFAPTTKTMYPTVPPSSELTGEGSFVTITPLGSILEGSSRPVFFRGVATVCMKLFNIITPDKFYFGQKDVQQTIVIKRMVRDFWLNTEVRIAPTVREDDGLAMSSRNIYLGERRRATALVLFKMLQLAEEQYALGRRTRAAIIDPALELARSMAAEQYRLPPSNRAVFEVIYFSLADPDTLEEVDQVDEGKGAILSGAVKMLPVEQPQPEEDCGLGDGRSSVRLIDNIILMPI